MPRSYIGMRRGLQRSGPSGTATTPKTPIPAGWSACFVRSQPLRRRTPSGWSWTRFASGGARTASPDTSC